MWLEGQEEAQSSLLWMGLCSNVRLEMEKAVYTSGCVAETGIADDTPHERYLPPKHACVIFCAMLLQHMKYSTLIHQREN